MEKREEAPVETQTLMFGKKTEKEMKELAGKKPVKGPPPLPPKTGGKATTGGTTETAGERPQWEAVKPVNVSSAKKSSKSQDDGVLMEGNDTYNLFAYQMEWSALSLTFVNALISFFNGTAQSTFYWIIPPIFALTIGGIVVMTEGFARERYCEKKKKYLKSFFFAMTPVLQDVIKLWESQQKKMLRNFKKKKQTNNKGKKVYVLLKKSALRKRTFYEGGRKKKKKGRHVDGQNLKLRRTKKKKKISFSVLGVLMALSWPFGWAGCGACFAAVGVNYLVIRYNCKPLTSAITDDWRSQFMNGCDSWTPGRMVFVAFVVIINIVSIAWGFINGYNQAASITDNPDDAEIKPRTYGVALGFGRAVTIDIALMLLLACYGCFSRQAQKHQRDRTADTWLGRCCIYLSDEEGRRHCHRVLAYSTVLFAYLHSISMYYSYESSGVQRTFVSIFGIETVVTGLVAFILLSVVIGSANQTILKQNSKLFWQTHSIPAVVMIFLLFLHGPKGRGQWYYMPVVGPFVLYAIDVGLRYMTGDK
ncbi:hypothetical protein RFI_01291 [Reticulomyxa filosa]|uniref:Ferric oxidoreductase domain-containing protein n=1 Tax=Reticulomyxa filosa TaxID=46433 RepID=X6PC69_RETFI|nr:hypothetical protein RFI_01291 [Reticulomyxa filosa]|eukprot:ETO35771.1 hypothetical protein RFI_01291 [Reticulomyxa filosa]